MGTAKQWYMRSILLVALMLSSSFSKAQGVAYGDKFNLQLIQTPHYQILKLDGYFHVGDYGRSVPLLKKLKPGKNILIEVDFSGGNLLSSQSLVTHIQQFCFWTGCKIATLVRDTGICASACIFVYMLGSKRIAMSEARFNFHAMTDKEGRIMDPLISIWALDKAGVDRNWLNRNSKLFSQKYTQDIKALDMNGSAVVTHVTNSEQRIQQLIAM